MKKEEIQIIQFDPDDYYFTVTELVLSSWDLSLAGHAHNLNTSKDLVEKIISGKIKPTVAIVEAYMGNSEEDGKKIATRLREIAPDIKIIGFSTFESAEWADHEAIKGIRDNSKTLIQILSKVTGLDYAISNIPDPETTQ